ncbi:MAG: response regulator [Brevinematales bacterium]|nr:response regulator [Brevinematales bacterium]
MPSVLIVDDSMVMRKSLNSMLTQAGYTVIAEASDGDEAIKLFGAHHPDIVTLDLNMPKMNGLDVLRQVMKTNPDAKFVVISAVEDKETVMEALKLGAKYYILKPVTYDKVLETMKRVAQ